MANVLFRVLIVISLITPTAACTSDDAGGQSNQNTQNDSTPSDEVVEEEITLTLAYPFGIAEERFVDPIEEQFPDITVEIMEENLDSRGTIEELISAQNLPDMVYLGAHGNTTPGFEMDLFYDLTEVIEERNFDLNSFESSLI